MESLEKSSKLSEAWDDIWKTPYGDKKERLIRVEEKIKNLTEMGLRFQPKQRVLDAGCGNALALVCLVKMFNIRPFGLDISPKALSDARDCIANLPIEITLRQGDVRDIPFNSDSFDTVMSWGVIEHFPEYELAIEEFRRVLRQGGTLNLIQPNRFSLRHLKMAYLKLTGRWDFIEMQINFSPRFLCSLLRRKGFKNIRYAVKPYTRSGGIINSADIWLNRFNKHCGYYLYILADKA